MYDFYLNDKKAEDIYYTPYWTNYNHRLEVQTYDITDKIKKDNSIKIELSDGWYKSELTWSKKTNIFGKETGLLAEFHIYFKDGSKEIIKTDESWDFYESYIRYSSIYHGETKDYTYEDKNPKKAQILNKKWPKLIGQINEPVRNIDILNSESIIRKDKDRFIIDFAQNLTGVVSLTLKGKRGTKITLRHAEVLANGELYTENLRNAKATDVFILDGEYHEYIPSFTWHGFRYIELSGLESLDDVIIKAYSRHTDMKRTGYFNTNNIDINKLYSNQLWSNKDNYLDIPTDCPQRDERLGWTADVAVFAETAAKNYDVHLTLCKWLQDLVLDQSLEYGVPHVIPNVLEKKDSASSAWADAATIVPWTLYNAYGDKRVLSRQYESMKLWVEYINNHTEENGLWMSGFHFGDWLALDKDEFTDRTGATDLYFIANVYYIISTRIVKKTAKILNKEEDYLLYSSLEKNILKAFRKEYITESGRLVSETQTALLMCLNYGLFKNKAHEEYAKQRLRNNILKFNHIMTGFLGTPLIMSVLSKNGMNDLCGILLLRKKFPGWLFQIEKGATTMWERWNSMDDKGNFNNHDMNSFNHCAYGSVANWFYQSLGGIKPIEPGYKTIQIKPVRIRTIDKVSCSIDTIYGVVSTDIDYIKGYINIVVPVGTKAVVELPNKKKRTISSGNYHIML